MLSLKIKLLLPALAIVVIFCSCSHVEDASQMKYQNKAEWVVVAGVDGNNHELQNVVRDALEKKGINCFMEGSIAYDVFVPKDRLAEAKKVLREDPRLKLQKDPRLEYELIRFSN